MSHPLAGDPRPSWQDRLLGLLRTPSSNPSRTGSPSNNLRASSHDEGASHRPDDRTQLLQSYDRRESVCGESNCGHGTFSPTASSTDHADSIETAFRRLDDDQSAMGSRESTIGETNMFRALPAGIQEPGNGPSATQKLAEHHGMTYGRSMYMSYYIPFFNWIRQYDLRFLRGDFLAALTVASIYIPVSLSLASNLAHAPAINGLYSFIFNPLVYAFLGSSSLMVVGPEAAGSLLTGTVVKAMVEQGDADEDDGAMNARVVGVVTGIAGTVILIAGIGRLGFLDNVLSRPFLRGFISAIGFTIFVDQLIPETGLSRLAQEVRVSHGSSWDKIVFLATHVKEAHALTWWVAFGSFAIIMVFRTLKKRLQRRYPNVVFFPDRFLIVVLSAVITWRLGLDKKGLEILGPLKNTGNSLFAFRWPFQIGNLKYIQSAMSTSFIIALLGFFESSVAAKGLSEGVRDGIKGQSLSANRELVALGLANVIGGCFMALPAFGGYGRSKLNVATGGRTPMSSIFLSAITFTCVMVLLPYLYYVPKAVLSSMISVIAWSLVEECPHDIQFFIRLRGWSELGLMLVIFLATVFYSLSLGIALGIGFSLLSILRHATKPRIQILGKVPDSPDRFENAELHPEKVEFIEGCLIVKIPEPLTFANTGDLKNRLRRLEFYGTNAAHPALPRVRPPEHNKNIIFDVHGVTGIDGSGTQVLSEIVQAYVERGVRVFFCRLPSFESDVFQKFVKSGIVESVGGMPHFVNSVDEALRLTEVEDIEE